MIVASVLSSSLISAIVTQLIISHRDNKYKRKELLAKAQASILKRVELCYRIRRRSDNEDIDIKNRIHDNHEENMYYRSLLSTESIWYGNRYALYLNSINMLTSDAMYEAWQKPGNCSIKMEKEIILDHERIDELSRQFSKDSRRFLFFPTRIWMSIHDKVFGVKKYDTERA